MIFTTELKEINDYMETILDRQRRGVCTICNDTKRAQRADGVVVKCCVKRKKPRSYR